MSATDTPSKSGKPTIDTNRAQTKLDTALRWTSNDVNGIDFRHFLKTAVIAKIEMLNGETRRAIYLG